MVGGFLGFAMTGEGKAVGFEVDGRLFDIRRADGQGDVISLRVGGRGALGPGY